MWTFLSPPPRCWATSPRFFFFLLESTSRQTIGRVSSVPLSFRPIHPYLTGQTQTDTQRRLAHTKILTRGSALFRVTSIYFANDKTSTASNSAPPPRPIPVRHTR
ncbi:hypothetical protein BDP81DRAFT_14212 [Colletotrichum phormii]|uniref:Uncharacterized protein n=1 Tax=Colletotrichum phormii TaxID=359342 RepID=A0AAJ0A521_9PEZI|nr:uncharacterized protein BDP81DRAFT_14212 [Colletotrichum phormii]KAK1656033.1 hypothetical protein BDP81DRAFT_14212 [Colletotrichum phormii]